MYYINRVYIFLLFLGLQPLWLHPSENQNNPMLALAGQSMAALTAAITWFSIGHCYNLLRKEDKISESINEKIRARARQRNDKAKEIAAQDLLKCIQRHKRVLVDIVQQNRAEELYDLPVDNAVTSLNKINGIVDPWIYSNENVARSSVNFEILDKFKTIRKLDHKAVVAASCEERCSIRDEKACKAAREKKMFTNIVISAGIGVVSAAVCVGIQYPHIFPLNVKQAS